MKATLGARGFFCSEAAIVQLRYKKKYPLAPRVDEGISF